MVPAKKVGKSGPIAKAAQKSSQQGGPQKNAFQATHTSQNLGTGPSHLEDCGQVPNSSGDALGTRVELTENGHFLGLIGQGSNDQSLPGASSQETFHLSPGHQNLQEPSVHPKDPLQQLKTQKEQRVPPIQEMVDFVPLGQEDPPRVPAGAPQGGGGS